MNKKQKQSITSGGEENYEPPPGEPPLCSNWLSRVAACASKNLSVFPRREDCIGDHCFYRKSLGVLGFVEFYPE